MRIILLLLLPVWLFAQSITLSALNIGEGYAARDAAISETFRFFMEQNNATGTIRYLETYTYTVSDSAFSYIDIAEDSIKVLFRYVEPLFNGVSECPVTLNWTTITKASPAKITHATFSGWNGGPWPKKIKTITSAVKAKLNVEAIQKRASVERMLSDHATEKWIDQNGKELKTKKEQRAAVWKDINGVEKVKHEKE
jgi:hypothetical protein